MQRGIKQAVHSVLLSYGTACGSSQMAPAYSPASSFSSGQDSSASLCPAGYVAAEMVRAGNDPSVTGSSAGLQCQADLFIYHCSTAQRF